ncbi:ATP-binding cassette domain-containing protein [Vagococcus sp. BWB3-3]|uniref:ATP-binding cassette domain-containing protein n=1 Tax=Vagococcus allomyrinae TaxID=2794353 RepID=A0A940P6I3_9ENTE|nr:ATP-binding cassette domain-containing protein [Vagococcus allomyrinae]MBP1042322.1 ATP-binding cassette domain-containing protein [Vagococcus allomyrinae]
MNEAISVNQLSKSFSGQAIIDGIDFVVPQGTIFALIGTNGAGKTTVVKMMTTLLTQDNGSIKVRGLDTLTASQQIREIISLTGQFTAVDDVLTGRENLMLIGKLRHLKNYRERVENLLQEFELVAAANRSVSTYSGGMRRKLDLAMSLISEPAILFLDEPTTGLDPQARAVLWQRIRQLKKKGVTIFLTTQYLEEADQLADTVAILNQGKIALQGSVAEVKQHLPQGTIELSFPDREALKAAEVAVGGQANEELLSLTVTTNDEVAKITDVLKGLQQRKIPILGFSQKQPTLDDVFFSIVNKQEATK